jgi:3-hydroxyacyl-[acyl-carrier-protein] dehydratase
MPRSDPLFDVGSLDLTQVVVTTEQVREVNAQRYEFEMLQGLHHYDREAVLGVGFREIRPDEFWVRGHIPGRPLFPGVLQLETAAQLCSYMYYTCVPGAQERDFFGFAGIEGCRFLDVVAPGDHLVVVARGRKLRRKLAIFDTQGFVDGRQAFEAVIKGAELGSPPAA